MTKQRAKEILDFIVSICSIVSCVIAIYGVFQVVDFVVDVKPIVVPLAQEAKEGNLDMRKVLSGVSAAVKYDTVFVRERDTIYLPQDDKRIMAKEPSQQNEPQYRRLTPEDEQQLSKSADNLSEEARQAIDDEEASFRQRMRERMRK